jgi:GNAT superfamily N-acetyltransferase
MSRAHSREWIHESPAHWDREKSRLIGGAAPGIFDPRLLDRPLGSLLPGDWWRAEEDGKVVGYGWMDLIWGDAEILLVVDEAARGRGIGSWILDRLEQEAFASGVRYTYNQIRATHPDLDTVQRWLEARRFVASSDGRLLRAVVRAPQRAIA